MTTLSLERAQSRAGARPLDGGRPARRAVTRWAWRLFRQEWRRQALVLGLLTVAIAATIVGLGTATNATNLKANAAFGTANTMIFLPGGDPQLADDIAAIQARFAPADVVAHQRLPIPGSVSTVDVRAESPQATYGKVTLRLDSGRYPTGPGEVAVTKGVAQDFALTTGSAWEIGGRALRVVGTVENPLDLTDQFALVAPGQANPPTDVSVLLNADRNSLQNFQLPSGIGKQAGGRGTTAKNAVAALVLVLATLFLVFIGLLAVAGFTVMAQRRLRALGMLRALGATDRHIRRVMLSNGAAVGATAAVTGTVVGLAAWMAFAPTLQSTAARRVDRLALPWWAVIAAALLTVATAIVAAWWPARHVARVSAVAALSGRPPRPQPAHRFATLGSVGLAIGLVLLAFADQHRAGFIIAGTVITVAGVLFLAPLAIRALAALTHRATISVRLAVRDLVRYQARSGAALGAVTLAIGIAATIAVSAAAAQVPTGPPNLSTNELVLHLAPPGPGSQVPPLTAAQLQAVNGRVADLATSLHARSVVPLEQAYDPTGGIQSAQSMPGLDEPAGYGGAELDHVIAHNGDGVEINFGVTLNVATPAVLAHYGLTPADVSPTADIVTARKDLGQLQIFVPGDIKPRPGSPRRAPGLSHPDFQVIGRLPMGTSEPGTLITPHAMQALGLQAIPAAWFVDTPRPLTAAQVRLARRDAASAGLYVETHTSRKSLAPLRNWSTAAGGLVALGVLGMTVGLIRSETANDLRTLAATGASSATRRSLTGVTSGALALLGAVLGTAGAYAALLCWHRSDLSPLSHVPVADLVATLVGVPVVACAAGWLLAGREPPALSRQPLE